LIQIKAVLGRGCDVLQEKRQTKMTMTDIEIVVLVVSAFSLFGGVLGWASWNESRRTRKAHK
jgi:hypothetical protein